MKAVKVVKIFDSLLKEDNEAVNSLITDIAQNIDDAVNSIINDEVDPADAMKSFRLALKESTSVFAEEYKPSPKKSKFSKKKSSNNIENKTNYKRE
jgi:hypothetical protein